MGVRNMLVLRWHIIGFGADPKGCENPDTELPKGVKAEKGTHFVLQYNSERSWSFNLSDFTAITFIAYFCGKM